MRRVGRDPRRAQVALLSAEDMPMTHIAEATFTSPDRCVKALTRVVGSWPGGDRARPPTAPTGLR